MNLKQTLLGLIFCTFFWALNGQNCNGNLLQNPGFESGLTNWSGNGEIISTGVNSGSKAIRVCTAGQNIRQTLPATAGKTYTLNGFGKKDATAGMFIFMKFMNNSWTPLINTYSNTAYTTNWAAITPLTLTAPTGTAWVEISVHHNGGTGCVYGDDLCLTESGGSAPKPDLTISNLNIPDPSIQVGQVFSYYFDLTNLSNTGVTGNFTIKSYLSLDETLSSNDVQDGTILTGNLVGGQSIAQVLGGTTVPANLAPGNYFLILKVDADNQIAESDETNNVLVSVSSIQILASGGGGQSGCEVALGTGSIRCVQQAPGSSNVQVLMADASGQRLRKTLSSGGQLISSENLGLDAPPTAKLEVIGGNLLRKTNADGSVAFEKPFTTSLLNAAATFGEVIEFGTSNYLFLAWKPKTGNNTYSRDTLVAISTDLNLNITLKKNVGLGEGSPGDNFAYELNQISTTRAAYMTTVGTGAYHTLTLNVIDQALTIKSQKVFATGVFSAGGGIVPNICRGYTVTDFIGFGYCKSGTCYQSEYLEGEFVADTLQPYNTYKFSEFSQVGIGTQSHFWTAKTSDGGMLRASRILIGALYNMVNDTITFNKYAATGVLQWQKKVLIPGAAFVVKIYENAGQIYLFKRSSAGDISVSKLDCYETPTPPAGTCSANILSNAGFESGLNNWQGSGGTTSSDAATGTGAASLCSGTSLRQTKATTAGKTLSLLFKAKTATSGSKILSYIKYMNASWTPLVTEYLDYTGTSAYSQATLTKTAPTGTAWVEIGFIKQNAGCILLDDVCLSESGSPAAQPDLTLANLNITNTGMTPGQSLPYTVDLKNLGTGAALAGFNIKAYFSTDSYWSADDWQYGSIPVSGINGGATMAQLAGSSPIPSNFATGNYYLILKADGDNTVAESNENNNFIVSSNTFSVAVNNCSLSANFYSPLCLDHNTQGITSDDQFTGSLVVTKTGSGGGGYWAGQLNGALISGTYGEPFDIGYLNIAGSNLTISNLHDTAVPTCATSYTIIPPSPCSINGTYDYDVAYINLGGAVQNNTMQAGKVYSITHSFAVESTVATGHLFKDKAYLSTNNTWGTSDLLLRTLNEIVFIPTGLSAYVSQNYDIILPSNTLPGTYYLIVKVDADNNINESNETNNILVQQITVTGAQIVMTMPANVVTSQCPQAFSGPVCNNCLDVPLATMTTNCASGGLAVVFDSYMLTAPTPAGYDPMWVGYTPNFGLKSIGFGTVEVRLKATDNCGNISYGTFSMTNTPIDPTPVFSNCPANITVNAPAGQTGAIVTFTSPTVTANCGSPTVVPGPGFLTSGSLFPIGVTTNTLTATQPASLNNASAVCSWTVTVLPTSGSNPDLTLANLNLTQSTVAAGSILNYKFDLKNIGTASASGNFTVKAYISTDNVWSTNDIQNGVVPTGNLAAGATVAQVSGATTIPGTLAAGNYYLILKVDADGQIVETNENNNILSSTSAFSVTTGGGAVNCTATSSFPWEDWIGAVKVGTLEKTSGKSPYSDFSSTVFTLTKATGNALVLTTAYSYFTFDEYWRVWIDYNHDNIYQSTEIAYEGILAKPANGTLSKTIAGSIIVPASALTGNAKMRVIMSRGAYADACGTIAFGEIEDYTVNIVQSFTAGDDRFMPDPVDTPDFAIFPNPAGESVQVDLTAWQGVPCSIAILNQLGQTQWLKSRAADAAPVETIELTDFSNGIYWVKLASDGKRTVIKKLIISRLY